jgi:CHAT domain-containing protein
MSLFDAAGRPQDGYLRLVDIYNLRLPVDLVVLSACSTALGRAIAGEGLMGLVRGFMYSGASRVVATLWRVEDDATREFMTRFYAAIFERDMSAPAALSAAQRDMWASPRWRHPFYWAAFVIQGDWR